MRALVLYKFFVSCYTLTPLPLPKGEGEGEKPAVLKDCPCHWKAFDLLPRAASRPPNRSKLGRQTPDVLLTLCAMMAA